MQPNWQRQINEELGKNYRWEVFAKGSSNALYRGQFEDEYIVLRKNGPASDTPGVNREREALLLALISAHQWAPQIIENQVNDGWCAMQSYNPLLAKPQQTQLLDAIRDLQNINLKPILQNGKNSLLTIDYQEIWDTAHLPQAQARGDKQAIEWIKQIKHQLGTLPSLPNTLVHHDLHLGNLALEYTKTNPEQSQLILLDWEYGGIGNAWFDASALVRYFNISPELIYTLPSYQHLSKSAFQAGLQQAIELSELVNKLWHRTRGE